MFSKHDRINMDENNPEQLIHHILCSKSTISLNKEAQISIFLNKGAQNTHFSANQLQTTCPRHCCKLEPCALQHWEQPPF